jgi:hypothetical protein
MIIGFLEETLRSWENPTTGELDGSLTSSTKLRKRGRKGKLNPCSTHRTSKLYCKLKFIHLREKISLLGTMRKKGKFSVKSAYRLGMDSLHRDKQESTSSKPSGERELWKII